MEVFSEDSQAVAVNGTVYVTSSYNRVWALDGETGDKLFVSVYDDSFKRFETRVLAMQNGKWLKVAELPFLTRAYQDATGQTQAPSFGTSVI